MTAERQWSGLEIAIVGMAGRFPGAADVAAFWRNLVDGVESLVDEMKDLGMPQVPYVASLTNTAAHLPAIVELVAAQGKFALIDDPVALDVVPFKRKSVSTHWELMFTRPRFKTADMIEQHNLLNHVADWLDAGKLKGTLKQTLSPINAANLRKAHAQLESGTTIGKIVLKGW